MCDCAPIPPFHYDFSLQSRRLHHSTTIPINKLSPNLPSSNPTPNRNSSTVLALTGHRIDDFKPRSTRSTSDGSDELVDDASLPSSFDFLGLKREMGDDELVMKGSLGEVDLGKEEVGGIERRWRSRGGRQVMRRSSMIAKQVISIRSACSLGFVSQLWVDTRSWVVVLVEVRPNLLSGDIEKFLLEDVCQVGDVVLVHDETVMENELKMISADTLVGYNVVTSERQSVGKVRGYTFNINSGAVESLELDSFGISVIPASLVSTYCLLVEDVLQVISDTVVVHEGAVSRLQRLTKGIWNTQNADIYGDEKDENSSFERERTRPFRGRNNQKASSSRKLRRRMRDKEDNWELPMDY